MMFISIVSHGHSEIIKDLASLQELAKKHSIIVTDNVGESCLEKYCSKYGLHYIKNSFKKGFGENNNQNYQYACDYLDMKPNDYFLVLNPDVHVTVEALQKTQDEMESQSARLATINLVKDEEQYDANIRNFPTMIDFVGSYLCNKNNTIINKSIIKSNCYVDWASGSFLLFESSLYKRINGFDEHFFMYCEDLDICRRVNSLTKERVLYVAGVRAFHIAAHNNRKIFSKHFLWHVKSVLRYCFLARY